MEPSPVLIVLQARMTSSRLPGKILAPLGSSTVLEHCVARLRHAQVGPVLVATSTDPSDDVTAGVALRCGVAVHRGPLDDVLGRYAGAIRSWAGPFVIRATADNPAVDPDSAPRVLQCLLSGADYVVETGLPVGGTVEGVRTAVLRQAAERARDPYDREHVTPYVRARPREFVVATPPAPTPLRRPDLRFTVDTAEDLAYLRRVFQAAGEGALRSMAELIAAADRLAGDAGGER